MAFDIHGVGKSFNVSPVFRRGKCLSCFLNKLLCNVYKEFLDNTDFFPVYFGDQV